MISTQQSSLPLLQKCCSVIDHDPEGGLQIKGCGMGAICAPPYANIFMGRNYIGHDIKSDLSKLRLAKNQQQTKTCF